MPDTVGPPTPPASGPGDDPPRERSRDAAYDPTAGRRLGDPVDEPRVPRGCHPLVFGVVMATIQFALTIYFIQRC